MTKIADKGNGTYNKMNPKYGPNYAVLEAITYTITFFKLSKRPERRYEMQGV